MNYTSIIVEHLACTICYLANYSHLLVKSKVLIKTWMSSILPKQKLPQMSCSVGLGHTLSHLGEQSLGLALPPWLRHGKPSTTTHHTGTEGNIFLSVTENLQHCFHVVSDDLSSFQKIREVGIRELTCCRITGAVAQNVT